MDIQPVTYRGRTVAACTRDASSSPTRSSSRPPGDPELTFVLYMCAYAGDVARGELPGPYTDDDARHYARACLIPTELLERPRSTSTAPRPRSACPPTSSRRPATST